MKSRCKKLCYYALPVVFIGLMGVLNGCQKSPQQQPHKTTNTTNQMTLMRFTPSQAR